MRPVFFRAQKCAKSAFATSLTLLIAGSLASPLSAQTMLLPTAQLTVGQYTVQAEIAATESSRSYGLMNRKSLPSDHGMLFVFDQVDTPCFWMKNTPLPLSIAFIDPQGKIVNIADMQPYSQDTHCPKGPVLYALEMEQGWFSRHLVPAGTKVGGLPPP